MKLGLPQMVPFLFPVFILKFFILQSYRPLPELKHHKLKPFQLLPFTHCKPGQVEPACIECWNGAATMRVSQVNLF